MNRSKSLGKGLSALIQKPSGGSPEESGGGEAAVGRVLQLPLELINRNRHQPRREFEPVELEELAQSIRANGVLQPVLVFEDGGLYTLIAGERRWRACQLAGLRHIPALVRERPDEAGLMRLALLENIQREDLPPLDLAAALRTLIEEHGLTQDELGQSLGMSRPAVGNLLRLNKLPTVVKVSLKEGKISYGHAKVLLGLATDDEKIRLWQICVKRDLSVRQLEELVRRQREEGPAPAVVKPFDILQAEESLGGALGARVSISPNRNRGQIRIDYHTREELDRLVELLQSMDEA
ncbi:MAG: ParB/RepB/Spo0J family partition protein [bacterium]|jgi:ParB family chromosome partitioning protein|nr:ParB/RepB/Spo0J family partition protein [bacterium]